MRKIYRSILGSLLLAGSLIGCEKLPVLEGKIVRESFYPDPGGFGGTAQYTALVELSSGDTVTVASYDLTARENDLRYDVGDQVKVREKRRDSYEIVKD